MPVVDEAQSRPRTQAEATGRFVRLVGVGAVTFAVLFVFYLSPILHPIGPIPIGRARMLGVFHPSYPQTVYGELAAACLASAPGVTLTRMYAYSPKGRTRIQTAKYLTITVGHLSWAYGPLYRDDKRVHRQDKLTGFWTD